MEGRAHSNPSLLIKYFIDSKESNLEMGVTFEKVTASTTIFTCWIRTYYDDRKSVKLHANSLKIMYSLHDLVC